MHYATPEHIHSTCNDYRAGATYDRAADEADLDAGKRITCPTLALWGSGGIPAEGDGTVETQDVLATWRKWCTTVDGGPIDSGHFVAEENPQATLSRLLPFLEAHR